MDVVVRGRHCEVTDRFRQHVESKLAKLERFSQKLIRIDVEVCKERNPRLADRAERVELTVISKGPVVRAEAAADDRHAALDLAIDKLQARLRKMADRRRIHRGNRTPISVAEATAAQTPSLIGSSLTQAPMPEAPTTETATTETATSETAASQTRAARNGSVDNPTFPADYAWAADDEPVAGTERTGAGSTLAPKAGAASANAAADGEPRTSMLLDVEGDGPLIVREKVHEAAPMTLDQALYEMELVGHDFYLFVDAESAWPSVVYRRRGYDYGVIRIAT